MTRRTSAACVPKRLSAFPKARGDQIRQRRMDLGLTQRTLLLATHPGQLAGLLVSIHRLRERDESVPLARRWPSIEAILGPGLVPDPNGLPGRIRTQRLRLGLTQEATAGRARVDVRTIRNVESGRRRPNPTTRERLENVLGAKWV